MVLGVLCPLVDDVVVEESVEPVVDGAAAEVDVLVPPPDSGDVQPAARVRTAGRERRKNETQTARRAGLRRVQSCVFVRAALPPWTCPPES